MRSAKMKQSVVFEGLESRALMSAAHPIVGQGVVIHSEVRVSQIALELGSITVPAPSELASASVKWDDGKTTTAAISTADNSDVATVLSNQAHTYQKPGGYHVTVTFRDISDAVIGVIRDHALVARNFTAARPIHATTAKPVKQLIATYEEGDDLSSGKVTISWGDNLTAPPPATAVKHGKIWFIYGTYQYQTPGTYTVQTFFTLTDGVTSSIPQPLTTATAVVR